MSAPKKSKKPSAVELMLILQHVMGDDETPTPRVVTAIGQAMLALPDDDFTQVWLACGTLKGLSVMGVPKVEKLSKHQDAWAALDRMIGKRVMQVLTTRPPEPPTKKKKKETV